MLRIRVRRGVITGLTALAGAALISACGSSSSSTTTTKATVNTAQVAASIEQTILEKKHLRSKVTCPAVVPRETGKTFVCTAVSTTTPTGKHAAVTTTTPFKATVQTDRGYVTYKGE